MKRRNRWMRSLFLATVVVAGVALLGLLGEAHAQAPAAAPADAAVPAGIEASSDAPAANSGRSGMEFWSVVMSSGFLGVLLWVALFADAGLGVYLAVDNFITVSSKRIMPQTLIGNVTTAMQEGDVLKALKNCEDEPSPLANILTAGFSHVEEGFEVIQDATTAAADIETERIAQKLNWMTVVSSLAPMLGLLGTVQGMIWAFGNIAMGNPDVGLLALSIGQALYTTAAGLTIAIPIIAVYFYIRGKANTMVLRMQALTLELIKDLRNVEVVKD